MNRNSIYLLMVILISLVGCQKETSDWIALDFSNYTLSDHVLVTDNRPENFKHDHVVRYERDELSPFVGVNVYDSKRLFYVMTDEHFSENIVDVARYYFSEKFKHLESASVTINAFYLVYMPVNIYTQYMSDVSAIRLGDSDDMLLGFIDGEVNQKRLSVATIFHITPSDIMNHSKFSEVRDHYTYVTLELFTEYSLFNLQHESCITSVIHSNFNHYMWFFIKNNEDVHDQRSKIVRDISKPMMSNLIYFYDNQYQYSVFDINPLGTIGQDTIRLPGIQYKYAKTPRGEAYESIPK